MSHVKNSAVGCVLSCIFNELVGDLDLVGNVLAANLILTQAKRSTSSSAGRALTPAEGADSFSAVVAFRIAESTALYLIIVANEWCAS